MKCFVSRQIIELGYPVRFMYREAPDHKIDSGWRFLSGFEDDNFINNPDNIFLRDLGEMIAVDPSLRSLLDSPSGSAFERLPEKEYFVACDI